MKKNSGVSMISLVITIIVIIILAAVAFGSSTDTIELLKLHKQRC